MILYLSDERKLNTYNLPEKVDESFIFPYISKNTNNEVYLNIYSNNGKWFLKTDDEITVNDIVGDVELNEFSYYSLNIKGSNENYFLYALPSYNNNYSDLSLENINEISIGKDISNDIICINNVISDKECILKNNNGVFSIELVDKSNFVYVNGLIVSDNIDINIGDVLYINNIRLIMMNTFIRVYYIRDSLKFSNKLNLIDTPVSRNSDYLNYIISENDKSLYKDDEVFFHKPRLTSSFTKETVIIDPPPSSEVSEDLPIIFQLGASGSIFIYASISLYNAIVSLINGSNDYISLIFGISLFLFSFLLPQILNSYAKKVSLKKEKIRQKKYSEYLDNKQIEISKIIKNQSQILFDNHLSALECNNLVLGNKDRLWERQLNDPDFLEIRLGVGNIPASLEIQSIKEHFVLDEDPLIRRIIDITNSSKLLNDVPITMSLCKNFVSSIICNENELKHYTDGIIAQIISMHNPRELKIVMLTDNNNANKWEYLKLIPHINSDDKTMRYFATNEEEAKNILLELEKIYNERKDNFKSSKNELNEELEKENLYTNYSPYYLIITDNYKKYKNIDFLDKLIGFKKNIGFSVLMLDTSLRNLPSDCNKYANISNNSCIFEKDYNKNNQIDFKAEIFNDLNLSSMAKVLANVPIQQSTGSYSLPQNISFLEMYNVGNIEQLNILNKWTTNNPILSLQCPIGVRTTGDLFKLDLHEKFHGPHGLIAGATGSGKSELIISFILSMVVNYHPHEVQFVLIDYKGGGLAGAFENRETGVKIPHLAGTITNLDIGEMNRTLVSIESELKRRQIKFNEARDSLGESTIDIYKYQKYYRDGILKEPIPHLFIICDEFAELKAQQPDFMDELISTARIGRSLGVHLILATQKPSGVVNDQIWSNSRFRICLKVQTTSDSMEMLKRADAASIKETGRFYLQVGVDELFELGQSAWASATYKPTDKVIKKVDDSVNFIDNIGNIIKTINNSQTKEVNNSDVVRGDQLTNIVKYVHDLAQKNNIVTKQLWLENIPGVIFLKDLIAKYNFMSTPYEIEGIIGEYDNPTEQSQGLLTINFSKNGNLLLYGMSGSGKETLLTTMIYSLSAMHTTNEINFYIMDFAAETLRKFNNYPQVGDVIFSEDKEKIINLFSVLSRIIEERKELFADYMGTYDNYIKNSNHKIPSIICIIHGYENFIEMYPLLSEKYITLYKDGPQFGIYFVITNSLSTGIRNKVLQSFNNKLSLQMSEDDAYRYIIDAPRLIVPSKIFGRGLVKLNKTLEFQTALISEFDDVNKNVKILEELLLNSNYEKAPAIPIIPRFFTIDKVSNLDYNLSNVPVGITKSRLKITTYNFKKSNFVPILTNNIRANIHFIYGLIELLKKLPEVKIRIIDVLNIYNCSQNVDLFNTNFDTLIKQIKLETIDDNKKTNNNIFIIIGLSSFKNVLSNDNKDIFNTIFDNLNIYSKNKFIIYDDYNSYKKLENDSWFRNNVSQQNGIWLGKNGASQYSIKMPNITIEEHNIEFEQMGYVVEDGDHKIVRYIVDKEFNDEE